MPVLNFWWIVLGIGLGLPLLAFLWLVIEYFFFDDVEVPDCEVSPYDN